jgi:hypothetical protein
MMEGKMRGSLGEFGGMTRGKLKFVADWPRCGQAGSAGTCAGSPQRGSPSICGEGQGQGTPDRLTPDRPSTGGAALKQVKFPTLSTNISTDLDPFPQSGLPFPSKSDSSLNLTNFVPK